jgi:hypothetical protein
MRSSCFHVTPASTSSFKYNTEWYITFQDCEPDINDLSVDYGFFTDFVWPALAHRVPAFNNSKVHTILHDTV